MRSSSGQYYQSISHIRAFAIFLVFFWHFIHFSNYQKSPPFGYFLSLFTEGHIGVSIFFTLSGYLLAKLSVNKKINFFSFLLNRLVRLLPLYLFSLTLYLFYCLYQDIYYPTIIDNIIRGLIYPTLPLGGWAITVELHYYLILPWLIKIKDSKLYLLIIILCILLRYILFKLNGEVQSLAYWTIIGRIDEFIFGIVAYKWRMYVPNSWKIMTALSIFFSIFYYHFDSNGGFYSNGGYPSSSSIWIYLTTLQGLFFSILIAWYDKYHKPSSGFISLFLERIGSYSYSIYLMHFFIALQAPTFINKYLISLSNPYILFLCALPCFILTIPIAYLTYRFVEMPFMKYRINYYN